MLIFHWQPASTCFTFVVEYRIFETASNLSMKQGNCIAIKTLRMDYKCNDFVKCKFSRSFCERTPEVPTWTSFFVVET